MIRIQKKTRQLHFTNELKIFSIFTITVRKIEQNGHILLQKMISSIPWCVPSRKAELFFNLDRFRASSRKLRYITFTYN